MIRFLIRFIVGATVGGLFGYFGGSSAGFVGSYRSPLAQMFDHRGRIAIARVGAGNGRRIGALGGVIAGSFSSAMGIGIGLLAVFIIALVALWLIRRGESAEGFVSGAAGGALLAVAGGQFASWIVTALQI